MASYSRPPKILLIDDDIELVTLLMDYLTLEGFAPESAHNGIDGLTLMGQKTFDMVILDVMMPGISGTETLKRIRERWKTPVLMLTARGEPIERIIGLELGADDYVPKPCPPRELVARMRAILRRSGSSEQSQGPICAGGLSVDTTQRCVTYNGTPLSMTGTELSLIEILIRQSGKPVPKAEIYPQVLGRPMGRYDRAIDVHVSSIRHKLSEAHADSVAIESVRGVGYQLIVR